LVDALKCVHNVTIVVEEYIVENPVFVYHSGGEGGGRESVTVM